MFTVGIMANSTRFAAVAATYERQEPDTILASTGLSGGLPEIQDDPDSYDGLWMVAANANTSTNVNVTFGTPSSSPLSGAGLQEFRVVVRRTAGSGAVDPTCQLVLWENGSLVRGLVAADITSDVSQIFTMTWDISELADPTGAGVELKTIMARSGGSPANRSAADVGAIEWNVRLT